MPSIPQPTEIVPGADLYEMPSFHDIRGALVVGEVGAGLPFSPERFFLVFDVPGEHSRGEHAHIECHQFLVCPSGSVTICVDDGEKKGEVILDHPGVGIHVKPGVWASQYGHSKGASLLVLASHPYDEADYIRSYEDWVSWKNRR